MSSNNAKHFSKFWKGKGGTCIFGFRGLLTPDAKHYMTSNAESWSYEKGKGPIQYRVSAFGNAWCKNNIPRESSNPKIRSAVGPLKVFEVCTNKKDSTQVEPINSERSEKERNMNRVYKLSNFVLGNIHIVRFRNLHPNLHSQIYQSSALILLRKHIQKEK